MASFGDFHVGGAVCPVEGSNGEETETTSLEKPIKKVGLFELQKTRVTGTITECVDQEVDLFHEETVNQ